VQGSDPQSPPAAPAQAPQGAPQGPAVTVCGLPVPPPINLPPAGSPPLLYQVLPACFPTQGNVSVVETDTYRYYVHLRPSQSSKNIWVPWDEKAEQTAIDDFKRLWGTHFLDNLWVDVVDYPFTNGVIGKIVVYNMEERQRVKIVDYLNGKTQGPLKILETQKIDDKLKEENATIRLDTFIDEALVQKVQGILKDMLAEKGYQDARVTHTIKELPGGPKTVHLTFNVTEGPKVKIEEISFIGNKAVSARALRRQMKGNKSGGFFSFLLGHGTYQETKFDEDADLITEYYRNNGYVTARVGQPELKALRDSADKKTRFVQLRVPVQEGPRYRVATFTFDGNTIVKSEALYSIFKLKPGDWYSDKPLRKGLEKARELYGTVGYFEFTGVPDIAFPGEKKPEGPPGGDTAGGGEGAQAGPAVAPSSEQAGTQAQGAPPQGTTDKPGQAAAGKPGTPAKGTAAPKPLKLKPGEPLVNVVMRLQEGKQYFVNRITLVGNTTTRDNVVRREMRLVEGGVFNTEALKYSVKRINQLGYFKNIEGTKQVDVQKTPDVENKVDVTLKVEEQNRNQITFGAGVSQFEGFFGQMGFQTANFMGRGETFSVNAQAGSRAQNYQVGFTEPFLFDRNITGGVDVFKREIRYVNQFTQASTGGNLVFGFPLHDFLRMFLNYSYETTRVQDINELYLQPAVLQSNPFLADSLLLGQGGERRVSKITPSLVMNSVDSPIFPTTGKRYTASFDVAGLGGNTSYIKPSLEGVWYFKQSSRTSLGLRAQFEYVRPYGNTTTLPIFERLFLGGEYSVRGFDLRSIGPMVEPVTSPINYGTPFVAGAVPLTQTTGTELVVGGNKSLLFNAEYLITIAGPVRLVLFFDAGQVQAQGAKFTGRDFKTSTGAEIRFFMPVLNVPFRLIMAYNPNRSGVLSTNNLGPDGRYLPQKAFSFRFAVGSTF
jgi:outer membrane protein assembly factor BamA